MQKTDLFTSIPNIPFKHGWSLLESYHENKVLLQEKDLPLFSKPNKNGLPVREPPLLFIVKAAFLILLKGLFL